MNDDPLNIESLPDPNSQLEIEGGLAIPQAEFRWTFSRSSGPGGQNVNKLNTKATLHWPIDKTDALPAAVVERFVKKYHRRISNVGELVLSSQRYRSQPKNIDDCLNKLRELVLTILHPPKPRKKTRPTRASKEKRIRAKKERSGKKESRKRPNQRDW